MAEPSPNAALGVVWEFIAKGSYQGIFGEASAKVTETISELGKRTETIKMFLREALYHLNELQTLEPSLNKDDVKELYLTALKTAFEVAQTDHERASTQKAAEIKALLQIVPEGEVNLF